MGKWRDHGISRSVCDVPIARKARAKRDDNPCFDAQLPDDHTFGTADGGAHTFDAALQTRGLQTIAVQDTANRALAIALDLIIADGAASFRTWHGRYHVG